MLEKAKYRYYLASEIITKTTAFLLPIIGVLYSVIMTCGFINAYIGDVNRYDEGKYIYLLFDSTNTHIETAGEYLRNNSCYVQEYDPTDTNVVFIMEVPKKWEYVYDAFLEGRYSDFGEDYLKLIPKKIKIEDNIIDNFNYLVIERNPKLKSIIEKDLNIVLEDRYVNGKCIKYELFSKPNETELINLT